ncbi:MAG: hypothetical protein IKB87_01655 [Clostridia bacterium]|nr:hypothetical protein [Clostridia bacterium]
MEKLKQKLSSRKLWAAVASGALCVIAVFCGEELTPEALDALKYAVIAGVTYIFGEGIVDVARQIADAMKASAPKPLESDIVQNPKSTEGAFRAASSREVKTAQEDDPNEETETDVVIEFE